MGRLSGIDRSLVFDVCRVLDQLFKCCHRKKNQITFVGSLIFALEGRSQSLNWLFCLFLCLGKLAVHIGLEVEFVVIDALRYSGICRF